MFNKIKNLTSLIGSTFSRSRVRTGDEFLLRENDFGTIHVEAEVVRRIVERVKVNGVHEIKNIVVDVPSDNEPLKIKLNLIITQDYSAPTVGANLRDAIKEHLLEFLSIKDALFDIRVTQINKKLPETKRRQLK